VASLVGAALVACGNHRSAGYLDGGTRSASGGRTITRAMIAKWNVLDAFEVVERGGGYLLADNNRGDVSVRRTRGRSSITNRGADSPVLQVDGSVMLDFAMLRRIRASDIERVEFLSSTDAVQRFGSNSTGAGAILVVTRTGYTP
jgi:hypothetical protein